MQATFLHGIAICRTYASPLQAVCFLQSTSPAHHEASSVTSSPSSLTCLALPHAPAAASTSLQPFLPRCNPLACYLLPPMYAIKVKSFASHAKGGELEAIKGRSSHHHKGWGTSSKKKEIEEAAVLIFLWLPTLKKKRVGICSC